MEQNPYALIANSICRWSPLRVTLSQLWRPLSFTQAIWGNKELMIPLNQSTGLITLDRASVDLGEMEINYEHFPIRKLKTGQKVSIETLEAYDAASRKGMGISPFMNCAVNIGTILSKGMEKWSYVGDDNGSVDLQSVKGFLNNINTYRIRATKSVDSMTGIEFYNMIKDAHSQLIMNIGNAEMYGAAGAKISIAIPSRYQNKMHELVTIPGGAGDTYLPVKVWQLIKSLDMVERVNIVEPLHVAAANGTRTNDGANTAFNNNELCIFMGFNNPGLCGIAVDLMNVRTTRSNVSRLLDESGREMGLNEMSLADEIARDVKGEILKSVPKEGQAEMAEIIDNNILATLNSIAESYNGIAPDNILSYKFEGWLKQWLDSNYKWVGVGSIYTGGGIVTTPGMMVAMGCQDTL